MINRVFLCSALLTYLPFTLANGETPVTVSGTIQNNSPGVVTGILNRVPEDNGGPVLLNGVPQIAVLLSPYSTPASFSINVNSIHDTVTIWISDWDKVKECKWEVYPHAKVIKFTFGDSSYCIDDGKGNLSIK